MSRNLAAAASTKKGRERFDKQEPAPEPEPTKPASKKQPTAEKAPTKQAVPADDSDQAVTAAVAKAESEIEVAQAARLAALETYGVDVAAKTIPKAAKQRIRRATRWPISVELTVEQGAKLAKLTEIYGSQRAAIGALIEQAELPADPAPPSGNTLA